MYVVVEYFLIEYQTVFVSMFLNIMHAEKFVSSSMTCRNVVALLFVCDVQYLYEYPLIKSKRIRGEGGWKT